MTNSAKRREVCKCGKLATTTWLTLPICEECFSALSNEAHERTKPTSKQPAASEDEAEELAKKLYEMDNYSRVFESPKIKWDEMSENNKDISGYRWKASEVVKLGYRKQSPEGREIVICAAIKLADGYLARGHRHGDCMRHINEHYSYLKKEVEWSGHIQGFMTSYNRFVTRKEGRKLQDAAGIPSFEEYRGDTLFSEDLY